MAYFDNAATTYPKPECVYAFMDEFYRKSGGSAGRGEHSMSLSASGMVADTRKKIQALLHCPVKQVVFTPTATIALNMIIQGIISDRAKNIYISPFEHNAVTRTLHHFEKDGVISVSKLAVGNDLQYDIKKIRYQFDEVKPDFVIVSHASNTIGLVAPVEQIFSLAKKYNAITLVDMAQTAGIIDCNIGLDIFDFAVFAGHKTMYGPTGIAGFVMNPAIQLPTVLFGGTGYESANQDMPESIPEKYEMGTLNIVGVAGLNAAIEWIQKKSIDELKTREDFNRQRLINLLSKYDFINIIGNNAEREYVGIVSCVMDEISSDSAGCLFDQQGIAVRTGLHCAPLAHQFLGTYPAGTIRFSVNYFTSDEDFEELKRALDYIEDNL
jgi:cysteine desulfurase family protein